MSRLLVLLAFVFSGFSAVQPIDVVPELAQVLDVIQLEEAHKLGYRGEGITVMVIDHFSSGHAKRVIELLRVVAPEVSLIQVDLNQGFAPAFKAAQRNLGNYQLINMSVVLQDVAGGAVLSQTPCADLRFNQQDVLAHIAQQNVIIIGAAGNDGHSNALAQPSCHPQVFSVGATYDEFLLSPDPLCEDTLFVLDHLTCFSNEATFLDMVAPGRSIRLPDGALFDGTSAAAPLVTGAIALMMQANPDLSPDRLLSVLQATGDKASSPRTGRLYSRLNVLAAVSEAVRLIDVNVPVGDPPQILDFELPDHVFLDAPGQGVLHFSDVDMDIRTIQIEQQIAVDGTSTQSVSFKQPPTVEGTVDVVLPCEVPGLTHGRITLIDATGNRSESLGYQYLCLSSLPTLTRLERALILDADQNSNLTIDDVEIRVSIEQWILGQLISDDHPASDRLMLKLIQLWVQQTPLDLLDSVNRPTIN